MSTHADMSITDIAAAIEAARIAETAAKNTRKQLEAEILARFGADLSDQLSLRAEPFGTVHFDQEGLKVSFEVKKKVEWDQPKLEQLYYRIAEDGANAEDFLSRQVTYKVNEREYKNWNANLRAHFDDARTVSVAGTTITIK